MLVPAKLFVRCFVEVWAVVGGACNPDLLVSAVKGRLEMLVLGRLLSLVRMIDHVGELGDIVVELFVYLRQYRGESWG
jgi:hypothetical protein